MPNSPRSLRPGDAPHAALVGRPHVEVARAGGALDHEHRRAAHLGRAVEVQNDAAQAVVELLAEHGRAARSLAADAVDLHEFRAERQRRLGCVPLQASGAGAASRLLHAPARGAARASSSATSIPTCSRAMRSPIVRDPVSRHAPCPRSRVRALGRDAHARPPLPARVQAPRAQTARRRRSNSEEQVWIDLAAPIEGLVQKLPVGMVEVRGSTGAGRARYHDVAIVVDLSASTRLPSGVDVNENGRVGKSAPEIREDYWGDGSPEKLCDDPGDTIAAAEIAAVRRLLKLLDPTHTRVALIAFGDKAELVAPLSSTRAELAKALDVLDHKHGWYGGTNYAAAIQTAIEALARGEAARRRRAQAQHPVPVRRLSHHAAARAAAGEGGDRRREAARARSRTHLHSFALGPEAVRGRDILSVMSRLADGVTHRDRPARRRAVPPAVGRAVRGRRGPARERDARSSPAARCACWPTARSTASCRSSRGATCCAVTAVGIGGGRHEEHRTVFYTPAAGTSAEVELEVSRLRDLLRDRTIEVELGQQIQRAREERALEAPERSCASSRGRMRTSSA